MKNGLYTYLSLFLLLTFGGCSKDNTDRNPFLQERNFSFEINLNLPQYGALNVPGSAVFIPGQQAGIRGVFVYHQGFGTYQAWEASCPNHTPNTCSTMRLKDGVFSECDCESYEYSLLNGILLNPPSEGRSYGLLPYRVTANGSSVRIFN